MLDIVFKSPKSVCQQIVHQTKRHFDAAINAIMFPLGGLDSHPQTASTHTDSCSPEKRSPININMTAASTVVLAADHEHNEITWLVAGAPYQRCGSLRWQCQCQRRSPLRCWHIPRHRALRNQRCHLQASCPAWLEALGWNTPDQR